MRPSFLHRGASPVFDSPLCDPRRPRVEATKHRRIARKQDPRRRPSVSKLGRLVGVGLMAMFTWLALSEAIRAQHTWNGSTSTWSDAGNWTGGVPGTGAGDIVFTSTGTSMVTCDTNVTGITSASLSSQAYAITSTGSGAWTFNDGGTITSSYANNDSAFVNITAQGNLTITKSTADSLQIGSDVSPFNTLTLQNNKTLTLNAVSGGRVDIYSTVGGSGSVVKTGVGEATLRSDCSYTGSTTVSEGTLTVYAALSSATDVTVASGAILRCANTDKTIASLSGEGDLIIDDCTLTVNTTADTTFSGDISDSYPGVLTKTGSGTLTLTGACDLSGGVNVNGGTLVFDGAMVDHTMTVGSNGTLQGTGTVYNLINNGALSPGTSSDIYGTMTVSGALTNNTGSTVVIHVNGTGGCSRLDVADDTTWHSGTVHVVAASGSYTVGRHYEFLTTCGTLTHDGTTAVTCSDTSLAFDLVFNIDNVELIVTRAGSYIDKAVTYNQRGVAGYLDRQKTGASGDFATVISELNSLDGPNSRLAFDAMSGELFGSLSTVGIENTERFLTGIANRLRLQSMSHGFQFDVARARWDESLLLVSRHESWLRNAGAGWTTWCEGAGVGASLAGNGNASGLNYVTGGLAVGMEKWLEEDLLVGIAGGYTNVSTTLEDRGDHGSIDSGHMAVYLQREFGPRYFTGIAGYGYNAYDTRRSVDIGSLTRTADAAYGGNSFSLYTELGQNLRGRFVHIQPYAALEYIQLHQNGFTETGADSVDLSVDGVGANAFRGLLGTRVSSYFRTDEGRLITLEGRAAWRHEFLDDNRVLDATYVGQTGAAFAIDGINVDRDAAMLGTGLTFDVSKSLKLCANYDLLLSANYAAHAGTGGFQFAW